MDPHNDFDKHDPPSRLDWLRLFAKTQKDGDLAFLLGQRDELLEALKRIACLDGKHFDGCQCGLCIARAAVKKVEASR